MFQYTLLLTDGTIKTIIAGSDPFRHPSLFLRIDKIISVTDVK